MRSTGVEILADVLDEEEGVLEVGEVAGADQALEEREVPSHQRPHRNAGDQPDDAAVRRHEHVGRRRHAAQPTGGVDGGEDAIKVPAAERSEGGARHRGVEGHEPGLDLRGVEERGDIGEPHDRLGALPEGGKVHLVQDAGHAVAAAEAPDRVDPRVGDGGVQVAQPFVVPAGEVAVVAVGVGTQLRLEPESAAELLPAHEVVVLQQRAGGATRATRLPGPRTGGRTKFFDRIRTPVVD